MKKVTSLLLVLVLALGMSVTSFAAIKIDKESSTGTGFSAIHKDGQYVNLGDINAGAHYKYPIATTSFTIKSDNTAADQAALAAMEKAGGFTKKTLPKVVARTRVSKGSNVIKKLELNFDGTNSTAQLEVKFVDPFKNNNKDGQEFDIWVFPVVDGTSWKYDEKGINIVGTMKNPSLDVDAQSTYVDLYNGYIANVTETIRNTEFDLGQDVVLTAKAYKGAKYWGIANQEMSEADIEIADKNNIASVYHLSVLGGLDKNTSGVALRALGKNDYVFDGDLKFLGMGDSKNLPFSETYYVADHMIEVAATEEPAADAGDETVDPIATPPVTGGDTSAPAGIFDNPSTGA